MLLIVSCYASGRSATWVGTTPHPHAGRSRTASPRLADVPAKQAQIGRAETIGGRLRLVPVRVEQGLGADFVQPRDLRIGESELCRGQIIGQLVLGAGADDHRGDRGLTDDVG